MPFLRWILLSFCWLVVEQVYALPKFGCSTSVALFAADHGGSWSSTRQVTYSGNPQATSYRERLGLSASASLDEIEEAHRQAVRKFHPDLNGDPEAFKLIQEAYDGLKKGIENSTDRISAEEKFNAETMQRNPFEPKDPSQRFDFYLRNIPSPVHAYVEAFVRSAKLPVGSEYRIYHRYAQYCAKVGFYIDPSGLIGHIAAELEL